MSRLFGVGVRRYADSVLIAAGDEYTYEADLELSRVTTLKGRGDATPSTRLSLIDNDGAVPERASGERRTSGPQRDAARALRQFENHAAGVAIRGGAVSTMTRTLACGANDCWLSLETPEPTRPS